MSAADSQRLTHAPDTSYNNAHIFLCFSQLSRGRSSFSVLSQRRLMASVFFFFSRASHEHDQQCVDKIKSSRDFSFMDTTRDCLFSTGITTVRVHDPNSNALQEVLSMYRDQGCFSCVCSRAWWTQIFSGHPMNTIKIYYMCNKI